MEALFARASALSDNAWAYLLFLLAVFVALIAAVIAVRWPMAHEFAKDVLGFALSLSTAAGVMFKAHALPLAGGGAK